MLSFIFYRPDLGYDRGMAYLGATLLTYCNKYDSFKCLINLVHSHHFLPLFRCNEKQTRWRIKFFNKYFQKLIPDLHQHFKSLRLNIGFLLIKWLTRLFSNVFNRESNSILGRIWDCFILEGELYAYKVALAILKYHEVELKMMNFRGAS